MRQAIRTRYHGPGNIRGARITARADAGSVTLGWDHGLNPEENHRAAAQALMAKMNWPDAIAGGVLHDGTYAWVLVEGRAP